MFQFPAGTSAQDIAARTQDLGLAEVAQDDIGVLGRPIYTFRITNGQSVRQVIAAVRAARLNAAPQPIYLYERTQDQNDPDADAHDGDATQYVVKKLHLAEAHRITRGDKVVVALIDSAIDLNQPNLAGAVTDRYDAGCGATAPDAHGTGMAGAIASHGELLGVAPQVNIIAICAFGGADAQPQATSIKILKGLDYAIRRGARIINMSFAGPHDPALSQALQIAREKGILVIAAAGNKGPKSPPLYPGADPNVMAVTATDENDRLFNGANQGAYVSIAAPGVNVLVPAPDGGVQLTTGTSVATANVSGVAALLLAHKPSLTPEEVRAILVQTAKHLGSRGVNPQFGAGLVDPLKALEQVVSDAAAPQSSSLTSFLAAPDASGKRVEQGFAALGYAGEDGLALKAPPVAPAREWLAWIDVRGADFSRNTFGSDLKGVQVNGLAGLTHKLNPDFLVGVLGGYEHFDYSSQAFNGVLRGDGWTAGAYLGWRLFQNLRFNLGGAWSDVFVGDTAGLAAGSFIGQRWLATGGLTGTFRWQGVVLEPSAQAFALWEQENAYTDSLGTLQAARNFETGRASGGVKAIYPFAWSSAVNVAPYVGVYGDYYFSHDDAATAGLTTVPLLQGWSARVTGGVAMTFGPAAMLSAGGEYGGIGGNFQIWTWQVHGDVAF
jgi:subtilisin family serine protease